MGAPGRHLLLATPQHQRRRGSRRRGAKGRERLINGGTNGLEERKKYLRIAKGIWMTDGAAGSSPGSNPVLRKGDQGADVTELQNELTKAGFSVFADGDFGGHTEEAVIAFQTREGLKADGIVGATTWAALIAD